MFVWLKAYPWQAERTVLVLVNILAFTIWMISLGVVMLRK